MSPGTDRSERHAALDPAWPSTVQAQPKVVPLKRKRVAVSMPREQRALFVADSTPFWPEDVAGWALCKALAFVIAGEVLLLAYLIWRR